MVSEFGNTIFSHKFIHKCPEFIHKCPGLEFNIGISEFIIVNGMGVGVSENFVVNGIRMGVGVPGVGIGVW